MKQEALAKSIRLVLIAVLLFLYVGPIVPVVQAANSKTFDGTLYAEQVFNRL